MHEMEFDAFIAMDWSGASGAYNGIAVAECRKGGGPPRLVAPRQGRWTRQAVADWIISQVDRSQRVLIGLDFGFSLPYENGCGYLGGRASGVDDVFELWRYMENIGCNDPDFGCEGFIEHENHCDLFWRRGRQPQDWIARKRLTERVCAEATGTHPDTLYKLIGSKQVGKASLTGMRVLHYVRSRVGNRVAVWPFEKVRGSAIVEIYPTLFRKYAGWSKKLRTIEELNLALPRLGSKEGRGQMRGISDHETDAMISAAGLRHFAGDSRYWNHRELNTAQVQREGWIFGVDL